MIRTGSLVVAALLVTAAAACSAPATPVDTSAGPAASSITPPASSATPASPAITFTDGADGGSPTIPFGDSGVAGACTPQAATPPAATWIPPHALHRNVCTPQEAAAIVSCFVQNQNCDVLVSSACHQCAVSGDTTGYSSALIIHDQNPSRGPELNVEGCVAAMSGDPSATGCGPKLVAKYACEAAACSTCADPTSAQQCAAQSDTTTCATQNTAAQCAGPYMSQCVQGTTDLEVAFNLVKTFCGP